MGPPDQQTGRVDQILYLKSNLKSKLNTKSNRVEFITRNQPVEQWIPAVGIQSPEVAPTGKNDNCTYKNEISAFPEPMTSDVAPRVRVWESDDSPT